MIQIGVEGVMETPDVWRNLSKCRHRFVNGVPQCFLTIKNSKYTRATSVHKNIDELKSPDFRLFCS